MISECLADLSRNTQRWLDRLPRLIANGVTFLVVMLGWAVFRATSLQQAGKFFSAMMQPGRVSSRLIFITNDMKVAAAVAIFICVLPRLPGFGRLHRLVFSQPRIEFALQTALALLFVCAVGKSVADPFKRFLYFRF
jgi:alginate O-acetyltransferase complex protein AlgI